MRIALVLAFVGAVGQAHADETPPWAVNVTAAQKAAAEQLLEAGNTLFVERKYAEALEAYRAAVAQWDHPAIRFNIVRCLIQLDRLPDASENLEATLRFGAAPLEENIYAEALAYQRLLATQLGEVVIACEQPGVTVSLDGQPVVTCPGTAKRSVTPGPHQIVGTHAELVTRSIEVVVLGGAPQDVAVKLDSREAAARIEHRWPTWIPWVVVGAGFGVAAVGGVLQLSANGDRDSFDRTVRNECSSPCSSTLLDELGVGGLDERAQLKSAFAVGAMAVGAATVATGAVLLYMNRGRTVYPSSVERIGVAPAPGGATLTLGGSF